MRGALVLVSLVIAGCAGLPVEQIQAAFSANCDGLPVTKQGACDREELDGIDPNWQRARGADIYEAMLTAYDRISAQVLSGALTEQQGEERIATVKAGLAEAAKTNVARQQAIDRALASAGVAAP